MILCEYSRRLVQDRLHNLCEIKTRVGIAIAMRRAAHGVLSPDVLFVSHGAESRSIALFMESAYARWRTDIHESARLSSQVARVTHESVPTRLGQTGSLMGLVSLYGQWLYLFSCPNCLAIQVFQDWEMKEEVQFSMCTCHHWASFMFGSL